MKKLLALALLGAVGSSGLFATADEAVLLKVEATILIGDPLTRDTGGISETAAPCGVPADPAIEASATQGIDGYWIYLGGDDDDASDLWGKRASLTATNTLPASPALVGTGNDVDAWFYGECNLIKPTDDPQAYHMATVGSNENGIIPPGAAWVAVDLFRGVNAPFVFTIYAD